MASNFDDPDSWRLNSPAGGVKFKLTEVDGSFERENGSVNVKGLILSSDLVSFLTETFPPPVIVGKVAIPQSVPLPGLPGIVARKVSFRAQDNSRPIDPFGWDPTAPDKTYHPAVEVTVEFGPRPNVNPDSSEPRTFLEISANNTGEFIHSPAPGAKWLFEEPNPQNLGDSEDPGAVTSPTTEVETADPKGKPPLVGGYDDQKDPTLPMMILVPQTEWTVKWNQVPYWYFYNIMSRRLRWCLGRVNADVVPILHGALPETLLFMGFNYTETYTWRDGQIGTPPINVEMKFVEKCVVREEIIVGHNHFWRPGHGWQRLLIDGENSVYEGRNFNVIWDDSADVDAGIGIGEQMGGLGIGEQE